MARKFFSENGEAIPAIKFENTKPAGYTEITDDIVLQRLYVSKYTERQTDGAAYYNEFRADLYLKIINGTYTNAEGFALEAHLSGLKNEIITGNWLTAQNTTAGLPLSGIYDQTLKDEIQADIDGYVALNY